MHEIDWRPIAALLALMIFSVIFTGIVLKTVKPRRQKIQCIGCKYCKKFLYKPFYRSYVMASELPSYCRYLKIKLKPDVYERCHISNPPDEFYEKTI